MSQYDSNLSRQSSSREIGYDMKNCKGLCQIKTQREMYLDLKCSIENEILGHTAGGTVGSVPRYLRALVGNSQRQVVFVIHTIGCSTIISFAADAG